MSNIALIGNPNCGKTTVYNALTGARGRVGNWPGVTVERKTGEFTHNGKKIGVSDLPGVYGLCSACNEDEAIDTKIARDYISGGNADVIVNVVNASALERNLYLTTQLIEMRVPMVIALNMMDVAKRSGIEVDAHELSKIIGCPVVPMVGSKNKGIDDLKTAIEAAVLAKQIPKVQHYSEQLEDTIFAVNVDSRWMALQSLENADDDKSKALKENLESRSDENIDVIIASNRYNTAHILASGCQKNKENARDIWTRRIDSVVLNRFLGVPIFLGIMYVLFFLTINIASAFIDFFDIFAGTLFVDGVAQLLSSVNSPQWLITIIADGIGGGVQTVATFIPIIGFLFVFLTFLENSGYMSRASFIADRAMRAVGLPGQAFIPMILGFGCTVPAVMAVRTIENPRARIATAMMAPFMSCGARLPVYALFAAAFFPVGGQNVIFLLYVLGIVFGVVTAFILNRTLLKGDAPSLVMELASYNWPTPKGVFLRAWHRLREFIFKAGKMIIMVVVVLSILSSIGTDGSFGNNNTDKSILAATGKVITPIVKPMGLTQENWPASVALFTGLFAKEVVVGTLNTLYAAESGQDVAPDDTKFSVIDGVSRAFLTIPDNIINAVSNTGDPLGIGDALEGGDKSTFGAMVEHFDGKIGALAYLMMILLYMPCVAATAAIVRETGARWATFMAVWSTGLGWSMAVITYQIGTIARHPQSSILWIAGIICGFAIAVLLLRIIGSRFVGSIITTSESAYKCGKCGECPHRS